MSEVRQFTESEFPTIHCTKLIVHPVTTDLKWDHSKCHPGIEILGFIDTAKSLVAENTRGVLANIGYLIGADSAAWYLIINESVDMYFGMAIQTQDLTNVNTVAISRLLNVKQNDRIRFSLTVGSTVVIRHEKHNGDLIESYIHDATAYNTQTLYPWISSHPSGTTSVKIMQESKFIIDVQTDGLVRMTGSENDIIDFSLEDIYNNNGIPFGGGPSGDAITNTISGAFVNVTDDGEVDISGGIKYKCENITTAIATYVLTKSQNIVMITNPTIIFVQLPEAADTGKCRAYTIIRNYNIQLGETWQNPSLKVIPSPGDTIELDPWIGLPPHTNVELLSDAINDWRVV